VLIRQVCGGVWLGRVEGFAVESEARKLGVVDAVLFDDTSQPSALSVRRNRFAKGVRIIDASAVVGIDTRARRVAVSSDGVEISF
jgi:ribosomal protein L25 (general stress protein Ctc)